MDVTKRLMWYWIQTLENESSFCDNTERWRVSWLRIFRWGEIFISISSEHATKAAFLLKLDVAHFRDATKDYLHYRLICWFSRWILFVCNMSVNIEKCYNLTSWRWRLQMSRFVQLTVQNPKIFSLLSFMTKKSIKFAHLRSCNQQMFGNFN